MGITANEKEDVDKLYILLSLIKIFNHAIFYNLKIFIIISFASSVHSLSTYGYTPSGRERSFLHQPFLATGAFSRFAYAYTSAFSGWKIDGKRKGVFTFPFVVK